MAFKTNTVSSATSAVAISSEAKLFSSLFTHSPPVPSSNPQISSANNSKSLHASPERNSFQHGIPMFLHKCKTGKLETAWELFDKLSKEGIQPDAMAYTSMIHGFCKEGQVDKANILFQKMEENGCSPDLITYSILMRGFFESNKLEKVVQLLHRMIEKDVWPDAGIYAIVEDMVCKDEKYKEWLDLLQSFLVQKHRNAYL
ncbi:hypothetical protein IC582_001880 [Cucumis melo]